MTEWRLISADGGKARRFELHAEGKKQLTVDTVRPLTLAELKALLAGS